MNDKKSLTTQEGFESIRPDRWEEWPQEAKIEFVSNVITREAVLELIGDLADMPDEIGEQSIHKGGLAKLVVILDEYND